MWRRFLCFIFGWICLPAKTIWGDPVPDNLAVGTLFLHARVFQNKRFTCQTNYFKFSVCMTSDVTSAGPGSKVYRTVQRKHGNNDRTCCDVTSVDARRTCKMVRYVDSLSSNPRDILYRCPTINELTCRQSSE
jgi:hypothetical protein